LKGSTTPQGTWHNGVNSVLRRPSYLCAACCCPCPTAYTQRHEILDLIGEPYICFGGRFADSQCCGWGDGSRPPRMLREPQASRDPYLFVEAVCCLPLAVVVNKYLIQNHLQRRNDHTEDCSCGLGCVQLARNADELEAIKRQLSAGRVSPGPRRSLSGSGSALLGPVSSLLPRAGSHRPSWGWPYGSAASSLPTPMRPAAESSAAAAHGPEQQAMLL